MFFIQKCYQIKLNFKMISDANIKYIFLYTYKYAEKWEIFTNHWHICCKISTLCLQYMGIKYMVTKSDINFVEKFKFSEMEI